jgi:hypothetical protein
MMAPPSRSYLIAPLLLLGGVAAAALDRPEFSIYQARVKQHRSGAAGDLVEGEEHLRKIILGWHGIAAAEAYEICHQCTGRIDEDGMEVAGEEALGTVHPLTKDNMCGGEPCLVLAAAPLGFNRFHMRYQKGGDWSPWSAVKNYDVGVDLGHLQHEEL